MSLLSISSKARVHLSPEHLSTVTSESTATDCNSDASILPLSKSFIQIFKSSKESWINICKIKKENDKELIQLCVKNKLDNLTAIGACKKKGSGLCYANGYSNGQIKVRELKKSSIIKEFSAPPNASDVFFLDFNYCDEFLASVYEDGLINVFGMQTSVKLHSFTLDNQSTLARFHPQKRAHLGVASYSGKVYLLDVHANKTIFKNDGHSAPCSDIAMSEDFILSSGYDSIVKIFDLRKNTPGLEIHASYGWTCISLSKCGAYFVGGNMKGELMSYDLRNIKKPLASARIEDSNNKISRVAFLSDDDSSSIDFSNTVRQSLLRIEEEIDGKEEVGSNNSFIDDIVEFQRGRISDFSSSTMHGTRVSMASRRASTESRFSDVYGRNMQEAFNDSAGPSQSPIPNLDDSRVNKGRRRISGKSIGVIPLEEINEELNDKENDAKSMNFASNAQRLSSIPTIILPDTPQSVQSADKDVIEVNESFKSAVQTPEIPTKSKKVEIPQSFDFRKEFDALSEKIHVEVGILNMDNNMRFIQSMTHASEQRQRLQERIDMIEHCMAVLLNDDFKINLVNELQAENQELRRQVNDLTRRLRRQ
jgi:WD40 repeat protein/polyhydroxyalkanoate synthesis regulator phasin